MLVFTHLQDCESAWLGNYSMRKFTAAVLDSQTRDGGWQMWFTPSTATLILHNWLLHALGLSLWQGCMCIVLKQDSSSACISGNNKPLTRYGAVHSITIIPYILTCTETHTLYLFPFIPASCTLLSVWSWSAWYGQCMIISSMVGSHRVPFQLHSICGHVHIDDTIMLECEGSHLFTAYI